MGHWKLARVVGRPELAAEDIPAVAAYKGRDFDRTWRFRKPCSFGARRALSACCRIE